MKNMWLHKNSLPSRQYVVAAPQELYSLHFLMMDLTDLCSVAGTFFVSISWHIRFNNL